MSPKWALPSVYLCIYLSVPVRATRLVHPIFDLLTEQYLVKIAKSHISSLCKSVLLSTLFSNTLSLKSLDQSCRTENTELSI
jgi:hypothetical protein